MSENEGQSKMECESSRPNTISAIRRTKTKMSLLSAVSIFKNNFQSPLKEGNV